MWKIGIDVGFGDVKLFASGPNGNGSEVIRHHKYPTAIAPCKRARIKGLQTNREYSYNGRRYRVGQMAEAEPNVLPNRNLTFLLDYSPLLVFKALEDLAEIYQKSHEFLIKAPKKFCVGLPLGHYFGYRDKLIEVLKNFVVDGKNVRSDEIVVKAQGQGILYDYLVSKKGAIDKSLRNKDYMILDIGYNTIDVLCVVEGKADAQESGMLEDAGICLVVGEIQAALADRVKTEAAAKQVLLTRKVTYMGRVENVSEIVEQEIDNYVRDTYYRLSTIFKNFLVRADKILLAGGGAYYVAEKMKDMLSQDFGAQKSFVHVMPQAEYSNARGYWKYL